MTTSDRKLGPHDIAAKVLFAAMIEREQSMFDGPDHQYGEYCALKFHLERHFPEATRLLRLQHNAKSDIPF